ncbi:MAG: hypothetical protein Q7Q73_10995 [Verrucomicrobiota bacterium JB024]|nr:hypothetical protein [Verrucomicrobiota bacterium JB024]
MNPFTFIHNTTIKSIKIMSSLKERVEAKLREARADQSGPAHCVSSHPHSQAEDLLLIDEHGECWQMPWSCLKYSTLNKRGEHFHLSFETHGVWLYGKYLAELSEPLAKRQIASIRACGSDQVHRAYSDQPFVERMTVSEKGKLE